MDVLRAYTLEIVFGLAVLIVLQFIMLANQSGRLNRLHKLLRSMLTGPEGEDLATQLERSMQESTAALEQGQALEKQMDALQATLQSCTQKCGIVRYDAHGDVSGQQSFSLALLDGNDNGIIITALYGRHDTRCFGKTIKNAHPAQNLSDEETEALAQAMSGSFANAESFVPAESNKRRFLKRSN
jgi:hypothetical protein